MRIGIFTDTYLPDINGVVSSVELLRKELEKNGHDAYVICTYKGLTKIKKEGKIIRLPGVEVKKLYGYALTSPLHLLYIEELKELNLDLIHAETEFGVGVFANIVASSLNLPLVRTYHTTYEDYTHYINFINSKTLDKGLKKFVEVFSRSFCNNCVKLITPSSKTCNMLKSYGVITPIDIIPTGIELDRFNRKNIDENKVNEIRNFLPFDKDERILIFVGRIAEEKSIDKIINAFKKVKENGLKVKLLVVGDGPALNDLKELTNSLDLSDFIYFAGKKPFDEVPNYYAACNGFISASTSETQGMTYIEALASGLMVLAHYDDVLLDIVKENENGYFFNNVDDIYNCIEKFSCLSNEELNNKRSTCIESVLKYDADKFGQDSIKLYKEAIEDYKSAYTITKTQLKDDCVCLVLKDFNGLLENLTIPLDIYYSLGLRNATRLSKLNYILLKRLEASTLAYKNCLKKLANRDYSIKEMKDYIKANFELNDQTIDLIIERLIDKKLLDDRRFTLGKIHSFKANFYSKKHVIASLKKLGISDEIIDKCYIYDMDSELANATKVANKYLKSISNKSMNMKKQAIVAKLLYLGYSNDIANQAVESLDFSSSIVQEKDIIRKEGNKLLKKYKNKYSGTELRNKVFVSLANKGFSYDNIYALINEMEL